MITKTPEVGLMVYKTRFSYSPIYVITEIDSNSITLNLISSTTRAGNRRFYKASKISDKYTINDFHNWFSNDVIEMLNEEITDFKLPYETFINSLTGV